MLIKMLIYNNLILSLNALISDFWQAKLLLYFNLYYFNISACILNEIECVVSLHSP